MELNQDSLEQALGTAMLVLGVLEKQAAGYTELTRPAHLVVELEAQRKKVSSLENRLKQLQGFQPKSIPNNLPRLSSIFVGRKREIKLCLEVLIPEERGWGISIDGLGGIGKTALAIEVAHEACKLAWFDAYLYVSAKTTWLSINGIHTETLTFSSLGEFCKEFISLLKGGEKYAIFDSTNYRNNLLNALQGRCALLIWDNLETLSYEEHNLIAEFLRRLPAPNKAIITSRNRTTEGALTIRLDGLSESDTFHLMREFSRHQSRVATELELVGLNVQRLLYQAVGGNPLALHWILGLIAQKGYTSVMVLDLLKDLEQSKDLYSFIFGESIKDLPTIDYTLLIAFASFKETVDFEELVAVSRLTSTEVFKSLERLVALSLVNDLTSKTYSLHPLTKTYINMFLGSESKIFAKPLVLNYGNLQTATSLSPQVMLEISSPSSGLSIYIDALLDTGAVMTCIPQETLEKLGSLVYGVVQLQDISGNLHEARTYYVDVKLGDYDFHSLEVIAIDKKYPLVGRDILNRFELILKPKDL